MRVDNEIRTIDLDYMYSRTCINKRSPLGIVQVTACNCYRGLKRPIYSIQREPRDSTMCGTVINKKPAANIPSPFGRHKFLRGGIYFRGDPFINWTPHSTPKLKVNIKSRLP